MRRPSARLLATLFTIFAIFVLAQPASSAPKNETPKQPTATGTGGAVATVDQDASRVGMQVLKNDGNAVDAAVATAAALGVTEPYSCGIGGGGFMVVYDAGNGSVSTIDSRETAPEAFQPDSFIDPATGQPIPFEERVTSGLGVGVPGTIRGWELALNEYGSGSKPLSELLQPSIQLANGGFTVDQTYRQQTLENIERFSNFTSTRETFLKKGKAPAVGSTFRNRDLAATYSRIADGGDAAFYSGRTTRAIVDAVQNPPVAADADRNVRPGLMTTQDLADYKSIERAPTSISYRGLDVYGMGPPSSGGSTVGEALNILEGYQMATLDRDDALHYYLEASRYSFADRGAYLGDPGYVFYVPLKGLLSDGFAAERRSLITETAAQSPVAPGDPYPYDGGSGSVSMKASTAVEGPSTTHLTVSDKWGNVVSYTFTIEQTGGSAITVPGYGFILNNELTDFEATPGLANSPDGGKRPRSSMSPTIVMRGEHPIVAVGSPGGSTIITTVLQVLVNHLDFGMTLPQAIAEPRASQRNTATTSAEPAFLNTPEVVPLQSEHRQSFTSTPEIGAATGIAFLPGGTVQAAAEPARRGGGSALVENPAP
ncbi:MAG: gamma-glutamyltransferase [Rubrobacter sp.]|nr:gamma-glutamyltransferase [Rubrobacter sp.]